MNIGLHGQTPDFLGEFPLRPLGGKPFNLTGYAMVLQLQAAAVAGDPSRAGPAN
jgi:hypothetical protein